MQPLLNLKSIDAQVELAKANNDLAAVAYLQTVQNAFPRSARRWWRIARHATRSRPRRTSETTWPLPSTHGEPALQRGRTSYLEVLDAQRTLLAAETLRIGAARDARLSIVDFAKVAGRGLDSGILRAELA